MQKTDINKVKASYKGLLNKNKTITSPAYKLIKADLRRWVKNTALFLAPALIIFLTQLSNGASFQEALPVLYLWLINTLIDATRKFLTENTYKPVDEAGEAVGKN